MCKLLTPVQRDLYDTTEVYNKEIWAPATGFECLFFGLNKTCKSRPLLLPIIYPSAFFPPLKDIDCHNSWAYVSVAHLRLEMLAEQNRVEEWQLTAAADRTLLIQSLVSILQPSPYYWGPDCILSSVFLVTWNLYYLPLLSFTPLMLH